MSDTPPAAASPEPQRRLRLVATNVPNMLATLVSYSAPPIVALRDAFRAHQEANPESDPRTAVDHFDVVKTWCEANLVEAARIVMAAVYLADGRCVVQQDDPQEVPEPLATSGEQPKDEEPAPNPA